MSEMVFGYRLDRRRQPVPFLDYGEARPVGPTWWSIVLPENFEILELDYLRRIYPPPVPHAEGRYTTHEDIWSACPYQAEFGECVFPRCDLNCKGRLRPSKK